MTHFGASEAAPRQWQAPLLPQVDPSTIKVQQFFPPLDFHPSAPPYHPPLGSLVLAVRLDRRHGHWWLRQPVYLVCFDGHCYGHGAKLADSHTRAVRSGPGQPTPYGSHSAKETVPSTVSSAFPLLPRPALCSLWVR